MDIDRILATLNHSRGDSFGFYERRLGMYQIMVPILHEDGDMLDIYLCDSPLGDEYTRICDFGMSLMRLSYTFAVNTPARQRILDNICINNGVDIEEDNLFMDVLSAQIYEGILQFAGCVQKICNMEYWSREIIRSAFYEDLDSYIEEEMAEFSPAPKIYPIPDYPIGVDWSLSHNNHRFFVFGVRGDDKAKNVAIALLEFQKAAIPFISLVIHENMDELGKRERLYLTRNADTQYPLLDDFKDKGALDIRRLVRVS